MTTTLLPGARTRSYVLSDELQTGRIPNSIQPATLDEAERDELVLQRLGPKGWGRLHQFRNYYSQGWGEGNGRPLSPRSLEAFFRFLEAFPDIREREPSVFLTKRGHLELCWEDSVGKAIQVEFTPSEAEYYVEAEEEENAVPHLDLSALAQKLTSL
jgi:hypothetical protein